MISSSIQTSSHFQIFKTDRYESSTSNFKNSFLSGARSILFHTVTIGLSARPLIKQLEAEEIQKLSLVSLLCGGREGKIEMNDRVKSADTTATM